MPNEKNLIERNVEKMKILYQQDPKNNPKPGTTEFNDKLADLNFNSILSKNESADALDLPVTQFSTNATKSDFQRDRQAWSTYDKFGYDNKFEGTGDNTDLSKIYEDNTKWYENTWNSLGGASTLFVQGFTSFLPGYTSDDRANAEKRMNVMYLDGSRDSSVGGWANDMILSGAEVIGMATEMAGEFKSLNLVGGLSTAAKIATKISKPMEVFDEISKIQKFKKGLKSMTSLSAIRSASSTFLTNTTKAINPLHVSIEGIKNATRLYKMGEISKAERIAQSTLAIYKNYRALEMVDNESEMEANGQYIDNYERDISKLYDEKQRRGDYSELTKDDYERIGAKNDDSYRATYWMNAPIIMVTDAITLDGILGYKFKGSALGGRLLRNGDKYLIRTGKGLGMTYKEVNKNILNTVKYGALESGEWALKTYLPSNIMEGTQEVLQNGITDATDKYFQDKYSPSAEKTSLIMNFLSSTANQVTSAQGLSAFMSGFFMGGAMHSLSYAYEKTANFGLSKFTKEGKKNAMELRKQKIENYNKNKEALMFFSKYKPLVYGDDALNGVAETEKARRKVVFSVADKDDNTTQEELEDMFIRHSNTLSEMQGGDDRNISTLKEMKNASEAEIKAAYGEDMTVEQYNKNLDKAINVAEAVKARRKYAVENFQNPVDLSRYKKADGKTKFDALIRYKAYQEAVKNFVNFGAKADVVAQDLVNVKEAIRNSVKDDKDLSVDDLNDLDFLLTTDVSRAGERLNQISEEISTLEGISNTKEEKKYLDRLKKRKSILEIITYENRNELIVPSNEAIDQMTEEEYQTRKENSLKSNKKLRIEDTDTHFTKRFKEIVNKSIKLLRDSKTLEEYKEKQRAIRKEYDSLKFAEYKKFANEILKKGNPAQLDKATSDNIARLIEKARQHSTLTRTINILSNPAKLKEYSDNILKIIKKANENIDQKIENTLIEWNNKELKEELLKAIDENGLFISKSDLDTLLEKGEIPIRFYKKDGSTGRNRMINPVGKEYNSVVNSLLSIKSDLKNANIVINPGTSPLGRYTTDNRNIKDIRDLLSLSSDSSDQTKESKDILRRLLDKGIISPEYEALIDTLLAANVSGKITFVTNSDEPVSYNKDTDTVTVDIRYASSNYNGTETTSIEPLIIKGELMRLFSKMSSREQGLTPKLTDIIEEIKNDEEFSYLKNKSPEEVLSEILSNYYLQEALSKKKSTVARPGVNLYESIVNEVSDKINDELDESADKAGVQEDPLATIVSVLLLEIKRSFGTNESVKTDDKLIGQTLISDVLDELYQDYLKFNNSRGKYAKDLSGLTKEDILNTNDFKVTYLKNGSGDSLSIIRNGTTNLRNERRKQGITDRDVLLESFEELTGYRRQSSYPKDTREIYDKIIEKAKEGKLSDSEKSSMEKIISLKILLGIALTRKEETFMTRFSSPQEIQDRMEDLLSTMNISREEMNMNVFMSMSDELGISENSIEYIINSRSNSKFVETEEQNEERKNDVIENSKKKDRKENADLIVNIFLASEGELETIIDRLTDEQMSDRDVTDAIDERIDQLYSKDKFSSQELVSVAKDGSIRMINNLYKQNKTTFEEDIDILHALYERGLTEDMSELNDNLKDAIESMEFQYRLKVGDNVIVEKGAYDGKEATVISIDDNQTTILIKGTSTVIVYDSNSKLASLSDNGDGSDESLEIDEEVIKEIQQEAKDSKLEEPENDVQEDEVENENEVDKTSTSSEVKKNDSGKKRGISYLISNNDNEGLNEYINDSIDSYISSGEEPKTLLGLLTFMNKSLSKSKVKIKDRLKLFLLTKSKLKEIVNGDTDMKKIVSKMLTMEDYQNIDTITEDETSSLFKKSKVDNGTSTKEVISDKDETDSNEIIQAIKENETSNGDRLSIAESSGKNANLTGEVGESKQFSPLEIIPLNSVSYDTNDENYLKTRPEYERYESLMDIFSDSFNMFSYTTADGVEIYVRLDKVSDEMARSEYYKRLGLKEGDIVATITDINGNELLLDDNGSVSKSGSVLRFKYNVNENLSEIRENAVSRSKFSREEELKAINDELSVKEKAFEEIVSKLQDGPVVMGISSIKKGRLNKSQENKVSTILKVNPLYKVAIQAVNGTSSGMMKAGVPFIDDNANTKESLIIRPKYIKDQKIGETPLSDILSEMIVNRTVSGKPLLESTGKPMMRTTMLSIVGMYMVMGPSHGIIIDYKSGTLSIGESQYRIKSDDQVELSESESKEARDAVKEYINTLQVRSRSKLNELTREQKKNIESPESVHKVNGVEAIVKDGANTIYGVYDFKQVNFNKDLINKNSDTFIGFVEGANGKPEIGRVSKEKFIDDNFYVLSNVEDNKIKRVDSSVTLKTNVNTPIRTSNDRANTTKDTIDYVLNKNKIQKEDNLEISKEKEKEILEWYNSSPISQFISLTDARRIVNKNDETSVATFTKSMITLFKGSDMSDVYHEAWHAFTQRFLTFQDKVELYDEVKSKKGTFVTFNGETKEFKDATNLEVEEYLAESFRKYMLGDGNTKIEGKVERSVFKKILDFLKGLFSRSSVNSTSNLETNSLVDEMFMRLRSGDIDISKYNAKNGMFDLLNSNIRKIALDGGRITESEARKMMSIMDSLFAEYQETSSYNLNGEELNELSILKGKLLKLTQDKKESEKKVEFEPDRKSNSKQSVVGSQNSWKINYSDKLIGIVPQMLNKNNKEIGIGSLVSYTEKDKLKYGIIVSFDDNGKALLVSPNKTLKEGVDVSSLTPIGRYALYNDNALFARNADDARYIITQKALVYDLKNKKFIEAGKYNIIRSATGNDSLLLSANLDTDEEYNENDVVAISLSKYPKSDEAKAISASINKAIDGGVKTFIVSNGKSAFASGKRSGDARVIRYLLSKGYKYKKLGAIGMMVKNEEDTQKDLGNLKLEGFDNRKTLRYRIDNSDAVVTSIDDDILNITLTTELSDKGIPVNPEKYEKNKVYTIVSKTKDKKFRNDTIRSILRERGGVLLSVKEATEFVQAFKGFAGAMKTTKPDTMLLYVITKDTSSLKNRYTIFSGSAEGSDLAFRDIGKEFKFFNYVGYTTSDYDSLSGEDKEAIEKKYQKVLEFLKRRELSKDSYSGKLVRRDVMQVDSSDEIFAVSVILDKGKPDRRYKIPNPNDYPVVEGGTGYAVTQAIQEGKPVHLFNQETRGGFEIGWYTWDNEKQTFVKEDQPSLTENFAGIGTKEINELGVNAIRSLFKSLDTKLNDMINFADENESSEQEKMKANKEAKKKLAKLEKKNCK